MPTCSRCGQDNPDIARFCLACGVPLFEPDASEVEVRKTVTIVFCDVTGSTAMGERLDPESLRRVMGRYFDEMRSVVQAHGGTVEKFIGDAVMAVFGVPQAHEDDALRAVRAADGMRRRLPALNEELQRDWGVGIAARIGVNTGEVVAGDAGSGQRLVTGDAVNVAARFEQAAQPGEVLFGQATLELVRHEVTAEPVEPLTLKGKEDPVAAYRLVEMAGPRRGPGEPQRPAAPMVGRRRELRLLSDAFQGTVDKGTCRMCTVLGPAGAGKSRLVAEFLASPEVASGARVLFGRCLSYGEGITYWPVAEAVKTAAGVLDDDPVPEARAKIASLMEGATDAGRLMESVAEALGLSEKAGDVERVWAIRRLLETMARRMPLVVVFDDIHWGAAAFLDLIEHIAESASGAPILLLCMARPDLLEVRPAWSKAWRNATLIDLEPLSEAECTDLMAGALGGAELDDRVRARIADAAEGNPLFVEEMLGMLIEDGQLQEKDGRWVAGPGPAAVVIPPTIHALLAARLDRLGGGQRAILERGAVEGRVFHLGAVIELSAPSLRPTVPSDLSVLIGKDLVQPDRPTFGGETAYRFRHLLLRDAAYGAMPKEIRADLHERFADWLAAEAGERITESEELVGYHLEQAYRYRTEVRRADGRAATLAGRAGTHLGAAGRRAYVHGDSPAAVNLIARATDLLPTDDSARLELLLDLFGATVDTGEYLGRGFAALGEFCDRAEKATDGRLQLKGRFIRVAAAAVMEADKRAQALSDDGEAVRLLAQLNDHRDLAQGWSFIGVLRFTTGQCASAERALTEALHHARRAGEVRLEVESLIFLSYVVTLGPTPVAEGLRRLEGIVREAGGNRRIEAFALVGQGYCLGEMGSFKEAEERFDEAEAIFSDLGSVLGAAHVATGRCAVATAGGDLERAEEAARAGIDFLLRTDDRRTLGQVAGYLARTLCAEGRYEEAWPATLMCMESPWASSRIRWRSVQALILARMGDLEEARALAGQAVGVAATTDFLTYRAEPLFDVADIALMGGRKDEAATALKEAFQLCQRRGNAVWAALAHSRLEKLTAGSP